MKEQLNGILLNEIVTAVLLLITVIVFLNSVAERSFLQRIDSENSTGLERQKKSRDFSLFLFSVVLYLACMMIWLPIEQQKYVSRLVVLFSYIRVFFATLAYRFAGSWIIAIIEEKNGVHPYAKFWVCRGVYILYFLSLVIYEITEYAPLANIPIALYYVLLVGVIVYYRTALGKESVRIMLCFFVPSSALMLQDWWKYTPANVFLVLIILVMYGRMWVMQKEKYLKRQHLYTLEKMELERVRTMLVLSQIKPHFIYNTLGTISYLCEKDPSIARKLTLDFAEYLRANLSSIDSDDLVHFSRELGHVKAFLEIAKVRFGEVLRVAYNIAVTDFKVPTLTVEPLVENAVKHGICQKEGGGCVTISTSDEADCYQVIVQDDGVGFSLENEEWRSAEHVGLSSVKKRVEILCGGRMEIESEPGKGTRVVLFIPKETEKLEK